MLRTVVSIQYRLVTHRRTYDDSILYRCSSIASRGKTSFAVFTFCHIFTFFGVFFLFLEVSVVKTLVQMQPRMVF